jgi:hypothetical protein
MRESALAERYAQAAINKRRELENKLRAEQRLGNYVLVGYLAEGAHLEEALKSLPVEDRVKHILTNSEMITSSDGDEGIHIVWCTSRAVLTHRLLSLTLRRELGNKHYLKTWTRDVSFHGRAYIKRHCEEILEARVKLRKEKAKQGCLPLDLSKEEIAAEAPQFLVIG